MIKVANNLTKACIKHATNQNLIPLGAATRGAAMGGIGGAGIAALIELLQDKEQKDYLQAALKGLGIGAAAGGLTGYVDGSNMLTEMNYTLPTENLPLPAK